jgi:hypothetical protein
VTTVTAARPGYLAAGCPSPLRFGEPEDSHKSTLPPLPKAEPEASFPIPTNAMTRCATETVVSSVPEQPVAPEAATDVMPPPISPQILVDYFRSGSSSNHNATAVVPFGFMPPASGPAPSSSATYISR